MKDPVGLLVALLNMVSGVYCYVQRESLIKPDSANRLAKLKKFKMIGMTLFIIGLILLVMQLLA